MCTVSWLHYQNGYELFCNRDERHTRAVALPPRLHERDGVKFIAPTDGDHGGSWIGVNEFGLSLSLLNRYQDKIVGGRDYISRGLLLLDLLVHHSPGEVAARMNAADLTRFQPFTLIALATKATVMIADWNGITLTVDADGKRRMPLTSSSFETERVIESRRNQFAELQMPGNHLNAERLREFHRSHQPERSAYSVCMHRDDAQTVSFSHIRVNGASICFDYEANAPCAAFLKAQASHSLTPKPRLR